MFGAGASAWTAPCWPAAVFLAVAPGEPEPEHAAAKMLRATKLATAAIGTRRDLLFTGARRSLPPADGRITLRMAVGVPPRGCLRLKSNYPFRLSSNYPLAGFLK